MAKTGFISILFDLHNNGTDVKTEVLAGVTSFAATMYIILVNPSILKSAGMPYNAVLTASVLISAFTSILMGLYSKNPIVVAPGMSINHLMAYTIVKTQGVPWETALGCVFWSGVIYFIMILFDRKKQLISGVPRVLRFGLAGGIGLFIALIGFEYAGFIKTSEAGVMSIGEMNFTTITFLIGFIITAVLMVKKVSGSFILGIIITTILAWPIGRFWGDATSLIETPTLVNWTGWFAMPDFSLILQLDIIGSLKLSMWPITFVFLFTLLFDSLATIVGVCEAGNMLDEKGDPRNVRKSMKINGLGIAVSALLGTSPATSYIESSTGIKEGGRTGLTAVVAGLLFLPFLFLSPLLTLVPKLAIAPVLVLAGVFMLKPLIYVRWERFEEVIPFFMAMFIMPFSYSITQGIIWGCLSWTVLKAALGKWHQIPIIMWIMDILALIFLMNVVPFAH
ncbi:MAG: NCS2 family permease [Armatimonadetes bacterium]|nr:NCS2 family permease [Armatimonadota bacterium]